MSSIISKLINLAGNITGTLGITNGGTGQITASSAFNALSPMTTAGDIIYGGVSGAGTRLAAGTTSQVLIGGTTPSWGTVPASTLPIATDTIYGVVKTYIPSQNNAVSVVTNASATSTEIDGYELFSFSTGNTNRTFTFAAPGVSAGRKWKIIKTDSGTGSVTPTAPSGTLFGPTSTLFAQNSFTEIYCDGTNYYCTVEATNQGSTASTFTFNGSGGTSSSVTIRYERNGDWIKIWMPGVVATSGTASTALISNTALPSWASPLTTSQFVRGPSDMTGTGGSTTSPGILQIESNGILVLQRDNVPTPFAATATAGCGCDEQFATIYYVGTGS